MGRLIHTILALMLVTGFTQSFLTSSRPDKTTLVRLIEKALGTIEKKGRDHCPADYFEDLYHIEHLFTLPSSNFLVDISYSRMSRPIPASPAELINEFFLDQTRTSMIESMTMGIEPYFLNPATFATAVTMEMYPLFLDGKINCPSIVLNKFMMRLWDEHYRNFTNRRGEIYTRINETAIAVFPMFETMPAELRLFVGNATEEMHKTLFNDTSTLTLALGLRDVVNAAHILYYDFLAMRSDPTHPLNTTPFFSIIQNAIDQAEVKCHTGEELFNMHKTTSFIFLNEYEDIEVEHVCHYIGEFVYSYMARRVERMPGVDMKWLEDNLHWQQLHPLCTWFKDFIHSQVFPGIRYYHYVVEHRLTNEFLDMFTFLQPRELTVLKEVLFRLGFPPRNATFNSTAVSEPTTGGTVSSEGPVTSATLPTSSDTTDGMRRKFDRVLNYNPTLSPNRGPLQGKSKRYNSRFGRVLSYNPTQSPNRGPLQGKSKRYNSRFGRVLSYNPTQSPNGGPQQGNSKRYYNSGIDRALGYNPTQSPNGGPPQGNAKRYYNSGIGRAISYNPTVPPNGSPLQDDVRSDFNSMERRGPLPTGIPPGGRPRPTDTAPTSDPAKRFYNRFYKA